MKFIMERSFNNQRKLKFTIFWAQQLINTHHKTLQIVSTGSVEWMNYMYTLWLGATKFPKTLRPFQKPKCWKSDTKEVIYTNWNLGIAWVP